MGRPRIHVDRKTAVRINGYKWKQNNISKYLWAASKQRAKKHNLLFTIQPEDIIVPNNCPYLQIPLIISTTGRQHSSPSLDRIDSTGGYTPDNIEVVSDLANRMKSDASVEQLIIFAKSVLSKYE